MNRRRINEDLRPLPHRILPPPSAAEQAATRASIGEDGVRDPALVDQVGYILDGQQRVEIYDEMGLYCPRKVVHIEHDWQRYQIALTANVARRQLGRDAKREVIANYLRADPEINDQWLADIVGGTSKNLVLRVRAELEAAQEIRRLPNRRCRDGKYRPATYVVANTAGEFEAARTSVTVLPPPKRATTMDATTAKRHATRLRTKQAIGAAKRNGNLPSSVSIHHCRFQELEERGLVQSDSANLVFADVPYGHGFLPEVPDLAEFASRVLVTGGILAVMCGSYHLSTVLRHIESRLVYRWLIPTIWNGEGTPIQPYNLVTKWKPVVLFSRGDWRGQRRFCDVLYTSAKEKDDHPWQQPVELLVQLVQCLSCEGDLVVDPCGGSFTTAVACLKRNRRFLGCDKERDCVQTGHRRVAEWQESQPQPEGRADHEDVAGARHGELQSCSWSELLTYEQNH